MSERDQYQEMALGHDGVTCRGGLRNRPELEFKLGRAGRR